MAVLGLRFCARASSSCGKRGPLFIAVRRPLITAASLVAEHRLQTRRLSNCGSRAQPLHGMWDLPRPGLEPVSPALEGRFSTTVPPGKPGGWILNRCATREAPCFFCFFFLKEPLYCFPWSCTMLSCQQCTRVPASPHPYQQLLIFCVCLWFFFLFLATPCGMRDLSSPTKDRTHAPCSGSMEP